MMLTFALDQANRTRGRWGQSMRKLLLGLFLTTLIFPVEPRVILAQGPVAPSMPAAYEAKLPGESNSGRLAVVPLTVRAAGRPHRSTHWKEGLVTGAAVGGLAVGLGLYAFCEGLGEGRDDCGSRWLVGAAMGALVGGGVGALIGGLVPKHTAKDPEAHPAPKVST